MRCRAFVKQELLIVLLFLAAIGGLATMLTLRNSSVNEDENLREELRTIQAIPISHNPASETTQGQDVPKEQQKEITTDSGLKILDLRIGKGDKIKVGSNVAVFYKGTLKTGEQFDSNIGKTPLTLTVGAGQVIRGWEEGLLGVNAGGKRKLIIPYKLGYGAQGNPPKIPPKAELTFEIEVVSVSNK